MGRLVELVDPGRRLLPAWAMALALLSACATPDPRFHEVTARARGIQGAVSCCRSIEEVLARSSELDSWLVTFDAGSPHFDFGHGPAPFAAFRLPPATTQLEVEAWLELVGLVYGGDGIARYLDAQATFLNAALQPMGPVTPKRRQKMIATGSRSLFHSFAVPPGAALVIVTTLPANHGTRHFGTIEGLAVLPFVPVGYTLSSYGRAVIRLSADPVPIKAP